MSIAPNVWRVKGVFSENRPKRTVNSQAWSTGTDRAYLTELSNWFHDWILERDRSSITHSDVPFDRIQFEQDIRIETCWEDRVLAIGPRPRNENFTIQHTFWTVWLILKLTFGCGMGGGWGMILSLDVFASLVPVLDLLTRIA
ncbi:hypothetical protein WN55_09068 [Dufourea novaeangliae]|uniref:Uncharacterized protein n=1 Tax=Dufourea novaeangliae TaxID=178035 RepID=A0A154P7V6_DUFNO|nr:hypothetical protein WN55_09068 [Dufourea novaeangliae]